jgi:hypothetical protein
MYFLAGMGRRNSFQRLQSQFRYMTETIPLQTAHFSLYDCPQLQVYNSIIANIFWGRNRSSIIWRRHFHNFSEYKIVTVRPTPTKHTHTHTHTPTQAHTAHKHIHTSLKIWLETGTLFHHLKNFLYTDKLNKKKKRGIVIFFRPPISYEKSHPAEIDGGFCILYRRTTAGKRGINRGLRRTYFHFSSWPMRVLQKY